MENNQITITIFTHNKPGVLYKIANLFLRRKINIESLTVSEIKTQNRSRFTIVVKKDALVVDKIVKQLKRIIEVYGVYAHSDNELIFKEIALIKVQVRSFESLKQIEDLAYQFQAQIIYSQKDSVVIQKTGSEQDIDFLCNTLSPFGIKEIVRSGRIAIPKAKAEPISTVAQTLKRASRTTESIEMSMIKKIEIMAKSDLEVISLAQGVPSFFSAKHIKDAAKDAIDNNLADKYTIGQGILPLREVVAEKITKQNKIPTDAARVIITHGAIEAMMTIFITLLNVEDEIIVLTPDYASHLTQITIATHGGKPVCVPLTETKNGWQLDVERLKQAVTPKTKAILICNPCNPTGKVFSYEELKNIAKIALDSNLYIITDEMYEDFVFDNRKHISIGSFKEVKDRVISVFGVSKSYSMTGWRIGYVTASQNLIDQMMKVHDSLITCPSAISQYAAIAAIKGPKDAVWEYKKAYEQRREIVVNELAKTNLLEFSKPQGAYYCFPKVVKPVDDVELCIRLVKEAKVAVVPGSAFGKGGENHFRISFAADSEKLKEGLKRLVDFLNKKL